MLAGPQVQLDIRRPAADAMEEMNNANIRTQKPASLVPSSPCQTPFMDPLSWYPGPGSDRQAGRVSMDHGWSGRVARPAVRPRGTRSTGGIRAGLGAVRPASPDAGKWAVVDVGASPDDAGDG